MKTKCIICGKNNIDGIIIEGKKMCFHCENKLLNSDCETDFYNHYKNMIKKNIVSSLVNIVIEENKLFKKGE